MYTQDCWEQNGILTRRFGPTTQIWHSAVARGIRFCASQKTYGHARIACDSRMAVGFFYLFNVQKCVTQVMI